MFMEVSLSFKFMMLLFYVPSDGLKGIFRLSSSKNAGPQ
jgi:hypothetical protein